MSVTHRVFLLEDHQVMRDGLEHLIAAQPALEVCGSAATAEEALEYLPGSANLVLVDVSLPGMNGIEFVREARRRWPELNYIVLSGHSAERYSEPARDAGAANYVKKGNTEELIQAIEQALGAGRISSSRRGTVARAPR